MWGRVEGQGRWQGLCCSSQPPSWGAARRPGGSPPATCAHLPASAFPTHYGAPASCTSASPAPPARQRDLCRRAAVGDWCLARRQEAGQGDSAATAAQGSPERAAGSPPSAAPELLRMSMRGTCSASTTRTCMGRASSTSLAGLTQGRRRRCLWGVHPSFSKGNAHAPAAGPEASRTPDP